MFFQLMNDTNTDSQSESSSYQTQIMNDKLNLLNSYTTWLST